MWYVSKKKINTPKIREITPTAYENLSLAEKENGDAYFVSQQLNESTDLSPTGYNYVTPGTSGNVSITYEDNKIIVDQSGNTQGYYCAIHCRTNVPSNAVSVKIKYKLTGIRGTGTTSTTIGMQTSTSDITTYMPNKIDGGDVTIPSSDIGVEKTQIITIASSQTVHVALYTTSAAFEVSEISYVVDNSNDIPTLYQGNKQYSHDVVANPTGTATDSLSSLKIDGTVYEIPINAEIVSMDSANYELLTPTQKMNGQVYMVTPDNQTFPTYGANDWNFASAYTSAYMPSIEDGKIVFAILSGGGDYNSYASALYKTSLTGVDHITIQITITYIGSPREIQIGTVATLPHPNSLPTFDNYESLEESSWTLPITKTITLDTSNITGDYYFGIKASGKTAFTVDTIVFYGDTGNIPNEIYYMDKQFSTYPVSGGSSGHTILNDGGTSLATESNLQFKGTYTHDDSTNSATVVEVTRSMTKDQYNHLSDDEKLGVIEIIDEDDVKVCYDIEGILRAGEDRITFSHEAINDNSTLDPYTNEVGVSPVNAFLSVDTSYTKGTIEVVTTSVSGSGASVSVTHKDEEGSTISTQSLTYDDVTGEENAYVLSDILEVFYDSDNLSWVVKALSLCGYDGTEYETGDVISTWVYSESVDMEIEQYSTVGSVTYVFPVQNHDVAVKLRITSRDCGPIDIAPHIVDYSTEEQNTGVKWIDGRYVYQKTYVVTDGATVGDHVIDSTINGVSKQLIGISGYFVNSDSKNAFVFPYTEDRMTYPFQSGTDGLCLRVKNSDWNIAVTFYITVQYIKLQ